MPKFRIQCAKCHAKMNVPTTLAGTKVRCPRCQESMVATPQSPLQLVAKPAEQNPTEITVASTAELSLADDSLQNVITPETPSPESSSETASSQSPQTVHHPDYAFTLFFASLVQGLSFIGMLGAILLGFIAVMMAIDGANIPDLSHELAIASSAGLFLHFAVIFVVTGTCVAVIDFCRSSQKNAK